MSTTSLLTAINNKNYLLTLKLLETENPNIYSGIERYEEDESGGYSPVFYNLVPLVSALSKFSGDEQLNLVKVMIEKGANCKDRGAVIYSGIYNAIEYAIVHGYVDVLKLFNCEGETDYIDYALRECRYNKLDIIKHLFCNYWWKHFEEYFLRACTGPYEIVEFFAKRSRLTPQLKSQGLYRALTRSFGCDDKVTIYLLSLGADPNYHEGNYSYLHFLPNVQFLDLLIENGLDLGLPCHKAAIFQYLSSSDNPEKIKIIDRLIELDPSVVNHRNDQHDTPLIRCAYWIRDYGSANYFPLMQKFIDSGADINLYNKWGESPITICAARGHLDELKIIIEQWGASIICDSRKDPLSEAKAYKNLDTVSYLEPFYIKF